MAYQARLESACSLLATVGSNPTLSALLFISPVAHATVAASIVPVVFDNKKEIATRLSRKKYYPGFPVRRILLIAPSNPMGKNLISKISVTPRRAI